MTSLEFIISSNKQNQPKIATNDNEILQKSVSNNTVFDQFYKVLKEWELQRKNFEPI